MSCVAFSLLVYSLITGEKFKSRCSSVCTYSIVLSPILGTYSQSPTTSNVIFQHPVALYRSDFGAFVPSMNNMVHSSFFNSFMGHYMFQPNWTSLGVQVMGTDSAAADDS
jgi:hypothetical protein